MRAATPALFPSPEPAAFSDAMTSPFVEPFGLLRFGGATGFAEAGESRVCTAVGQKH